MYINVYKTFMFIYFIFYIIFIVLSSPSNVANITALRLIKVFLFIHERKTLLGISSITQILP